MEGNKDLEETTVGDFNPDIDDDIIDIMEDLDDKERPRKIFKKDQCDTAENHQDSSDSFLNAIEDYEISTAENEETKLPSNEIGTDESLGVDEVIDPVKGEQVVDENDSEEMLEMLEMLATDMNSVSSYSHSSEDEGKSSLVDLLEGWLNDLYADGQRLQDVQESNERQGHGTAERDKARNSAVEFTNSDDLLRDIFTEWQGGGTGEVCTEIEIEVTTGKKNCPVHVEEDIVQDTALCESIDGQDSLEEFLPDVDFIDFDEYDEN